MRRVLEIIGDILVIVFGIILSYIFYTIFICGSFGKEENPLTLKFELVMGVIILLFGIYLLVKDIKK